MFEALCNHIKYSTNKGNLRWELFIPSQLVYVLNYILCVLPFINTSSITTMVMTWWILHMYKVHGKLKLYFDLHIFIESPRSAITIFPQRTDGKHDFRIWNAQVCTKKYACFDYNLNNYLSLNSPLNLADFLCWLYKFGRIDHWWPNKYWNNWSTVLIQVWIGLYLVNMYFTSTGLS